SRPWPARSSHAQRSYMAPKSAGWLRQTTEGESNTKAPRLRPQAPYSSLVSLAARSTRLFRTRGDIQPVPPHSQNCLVGDAGFPCSPCPVLLCREQAIAPSLRMQSLSQYLPGSRLHSTSAISLSRARTRSGVPALARFAVGNSRLSRRVASLRVTIDFRQLDGMRRSSP